MEAMSDIAKYSKWKLNSPILYDFIYTKKMEWPCTACKWSGICNSQEHMTQQSLYVGCRTDGVYREKSNSWEGMASYLISTVVDIPNQGYSLYSNIAQTAFQRKYNRKVQVEKIVLHPGEVNTIKVWCKNPYLVATHSDSCLTYIWDMKIYENPTERRDTQAHTPILMYFHLILSFLVLKDILEWHHML